MKINKSFIRIALAAGLIGLAACGGSDSSSRNRNTLMEDGSICFTDVERAGLIENAAPRAQQDAVAYQAAIPAQDEVTGQPEVKAQDAVPAEVLEEEIPEVKEQAEVLYQAAVPDQPEVQERARQWYWDDRPGTVGDFIEDYANAGNPYIWVDDHHITWLGAAYNRENVSWTLVDASPYKPAVKGTPEVAAQPAVKGRPGYPKGFVLKEAIPAIVGQPEVKAQPAVAAQPEILAREEIKGATKEEVIEEINAVESCPTSTVPSSATPAPTVELSYDAFAGDERQRATFTWTPDEADKEIYFTRVTQNGYNTGDGLAKAGKFRVTSNTLNPGCDDFGTFNLIRKSDDQLMAVVEFNYPEQDMSKCAIVVPETTVPNEPQPTVPNEPQPTVPNVTMTTEATQVTTAEAPNTTVEVTTTEAPAVTLAPAVEATAKTAIVTETATEVQLPAAAVEVSIKVEDVYTGFNVSASDVKSVEYQVSGGSWTAVTASTPVKIPKAASKLSVRVTKTSGEKVVSEKTIERTEAPVDTTVAPADTTMAPADTTAPVTTEAPASSDSSSSNNTLLYILGFIIVAGAAAFFFKKKSASTK